MRRYMRAAKPEQIIDPDAPRVPMTVRFTGVPREPGNYTVSIDAVHKGGETLVVSVSEVPRVP